MLNDHYSGRTAPLTSKRCILYIYSTNIGTEYLKHGIYSPCFFSSKCSLFHNSNVFGSCVIHILYKKVLKLKKIIPAPRGWRTLRVILFWRNVKTKAWWTISKLLYVAGSLKLHVWSLTTKCIYVIYIDFKTNDN